MNIDNPDYHKLNQNKVIFGFDLKIGITGTNGTNQHFKVPLDWKFDGILLIYFQIQLLFKINNPISKQNQLIIRNLSSTK